MYMSYEEHLEDGDSGNSGNSGNSEHSRHHRHHRHHRHNRHRNSYYSNDLFTARFILIIFALFILLSVILLVSSSKN